MMKKHPKEEEGNMRFKIVSCGKIIAAFLNGCDRDLCVEALREAYEDCIFETRDDLRGK